MADERWDDFRVFLQVAKYSSVKRAAKELNITQSAVSKRIDRLEKALGTALFERGPIGTKLTVQGQRILPRALAAEAELLNAMKGSAKSHDRVSGECRIQMSDGIANYWFAPFLPVFFERYPDIELKVMMDLGGSPDPNELFDIKLHYEMPMDTSLISRPLGTVHFIPCAARSYIARYGMPKTVADLANHRLLDQAKYLVSKGTWATWFTEAPLTRTSLFTNQSVFLATATQQGAGITLMPSYLLIQDPDLVPIDIGMRFSLRLMGSYRRENAAKPAVRTTMDFLKDVVFDTKNMPWFSDAYIKPNPEWTRAFALAFERAQPPITLAAQ